MAVNDYLIQRLHEWVLQELLVFGDGTIGVVHALNCTDKEIDFIRVKYGENATLIACSHAKYTGEAGVCFNIRTRSNLFIEWIV